MKPIVSVIIPVYKVDEYIRQCVESVLAQTYKHIEVILVDDGSPDLCGLICDEYKAIDNRIRVIHKENGGLSDARNVGVSIATGEYIVFLDGDDFWEDINALERIMQRQMETNADVLNYSYVCMFENSNQKKLYYNHVDAMPRLSTKKAQLDYLTKHGLYIASACNKLIRKHVLDGLEFCKGVYSEDIEWCAKLLIKAKSMDFVCENFYIYRQHDKSIRHTITDKKCKDLSENIIRCIQMTDAVSDEVKEALLHYCAFQFGTFFVVQAQAKNIPIECIRKMKAFCWILNYHGNNKKLYVLNIICKLLGYEKTCRLVRLMHRNNK